MPSKAKRLKLEAAAARLDFVKDRFTDVCKSLQLRRKWIPDVVFAGALNNLFKIGVTATEVNSVIQKCEGLVLSSDNEKRLSIAVSKILLTRPSKTP